MVSGVGVKGWGLGVKVWVLSLGLIAYPTGQSPNVSLHVGEYSKLRRCDADFRRQGPRVLKPSPVCCIPYDRLCMQNKPCPRSPCANVAVKHIPRPYNTVCRNPLKV